MKLVDRSLIEDLTDGEIQEICKFADLDLLLTPMKAHPEFYKKYTKSLGRLDKKSALVQKLLPKYAFDLFEKGDEKYIEAISLMAKNLKDNFVNHLAESIAPPTTIEEVKKYSLDEYEMLYKKVLDISVSEVSFEMFFVFLKLNDITFSEEEQQQLIEKLKNAVDLRKLEEKYQHEKEEEIKKREVELLATCEIEKSNLKKELNRCRKELLEVSKREKSVTEELLEIRAKQENEKESVVSEWVRKAEQEASEKKLELDHEIKEYRTNRLKEINDMCADRLSIRETEIKGQIEKLEQDLSSRKQELEDYIIEQNNTKKKIECEISELTQEKIRRQADVTRLEQREKDFYECLDERAVEHRLSNVIFESRVQEDETQNAPPIILNENVVSIHRKDDFSQPIEKSENIDKIDDFAEDLKDNIALNFNDSSEIAAIIIASLLGGKAIIVEDCIGILLAESLSALIDGNTAIVIETAGASIGSLVKAINEIEERVIYIEGIMDKFDEIMFEKICRECCNKYLFFGVSDVKNIKMFSKNVFTYAVVLDVENELQFPETDSIFVANHSIDIFKTQYDSKSCRMYYDKYFRSLVANGIMNQRTCIDLSMILQTYFYFIRNEALGEVIKKSILLSCDYNTNDENSDKKEILTKSGVI